MKRREDSRLFEIVPDSEDESVRKQLRLKVATTVIDISSDEEDFVISHPSPTKAKFNAPWVEPRGPAQAELKPSPPPIDEIIELTDTSSDEIDKPTIRNNIEMVTGLSKENPLPRVPKVPWATLDDAIFVLNEPKSSRRPFKSPTKPRAPEEPVLRTVGKTVLTIGDSTAGTPTKKRAAKGESSEVDSARERYAQDLFNALNTAVFGDKIPLSTRLVWNKRLLSTAGRAKYRRSRDGTEFSEIELAPKILDCEERIRFTLSHEMCHLATWIIDKNMQESHGPRFKAWANRVMKARSDIVINTKHNYEINYPYQWKCRECSRIYGRFSKSIKTSEVLCGACKTGRLEPMFKTRTKKTAAIGNLVGTARVPPPQRRKEGAEDITDEGENLEDLMAKIHSIALDL